MILRALVINGRLARAVEPAMAFLARRGHDVAFTVMDRLSTTDGPEAVIAASGLRTIPFAEVQAAAAAGPLILTPRDWGNPPDLVRGLERARVNGAIIVGMNEAARFANPNRYRGCDHVLGWGPSARRIFGLSAHIVGWADLDMHPPLDRKVSGRMALINYKMKRGDLGDYDPGDFWLRTVLAACEAAGFEPLVTSHPAGRAPLVDVPVTDQPGLSMLDRAAVFVTPGSTMLYSALCRECPVVLAPFAREPLAEMSRSMGAYEIADTAERLAAAMTRAAAHRDPAGAARSFLNYHISQIPGRPVSRRIAAALTRIAAESPATGG